MEIKKGDYVTRNSYKNDIVFKVIRIEENICYLKGNEIRLLADSPKDDLTKINGELVKKLSVKIEPEDKEFMRGEYFFLPAKILHIDGDSEFLDKCLKYYKEAGIYAVGKKIKENKIYEQIQLLLREHNPDILIITGHDSYDSKSADIHNKKNYKNTEYFIRAVNEARKYEKSHEKLVIIAGACQSDYESLIKAGANFASSPKRVNIHALDPAIIATNLALTERNKPINLLDLLSKTKNGKDGIGGIQCNGLMYVGYPR